MPHVNQIGTGDKSVASAQTSFEQTLVLTADAQAFSFSLLNLGMPRVQFYIYQTIGAVGSSVVPQFSVSEDDEGKVKWYPITTPQIAPLLVPISLPVTISSKEVRLAVTRPAGQATTLDVVIMAAQ
jgi:hypothetical protein